MIGDAAHASTPFMGQGGAMAVGDAIVLADMLSEGGSVASTLEAFGHRRYPVCRYVQDTSRSVGERGATENPDTAIRRNATMEQAAQSEVDDFLRELDASEDRARRAGIQALRLSCMLATLVDRCNAAGAAH
jgi:2-polyprenyl-6-methoxyphenol hydroxylase-like FAD-dependent oxidoreductase